MNPGYDEILTGLARVEGRIAHIEDWVKIQEREVAVRNRALYPEDQRIAYRLARIESRISVLEREALKPSDVDV